MAEDALLQSEHSAILNIDAYHRDANSSLRLYFSDANPEYAACFTGRRPLEIVEILIDRLNETELRSCLSLLSLLEATFRTDFMIRCNMRKRDPISRACRALHKNHGPRSRLDDILTIWQKEYSGANRIMAELKGAFNFRHWLAHGRYWTLKRRYTYLWIYGLAASIMTELPLHQRQG